MKKNILFFLFCCFLQSINVVAIPPVWEQLMDQLKVARNRITALEKDIKQLKEDVKYRDEIIRQKNNYIKKIEKQIEQYKKQDLLKNKIIDSLNKKIEEIQTNSNKQTQTTLEDIIQQKNQTIAEKNAIIQTQDLIIKDLKSRIDELQTCIEQKELIIEEQNIKMQELKNGYEEIRKLFKDIRKVYFLENSKVQFSIDRDYLIITVKYFQIEKPFPDDYYIEYRFYEQGSSGEDNIARGEINFRKVDSPESENEKNINEAASRVALETPNIYGLQYYENTTQIPLPQTKEQKEKYKYYQLFIRQRSVSGSPKFIKRHTPIE